MLSQEKDKILLLIFVFTISSAFSPFNVRALNESIDIMGGRYVKFDGTEIMGTNAIIGIVDSGIDLNHPDVGIKVIDWEDATGSPLIIDDYEGHGTHIASIAAGTGTASGGRYKGVAPGATLLIVKASYPKEVADGVQWLRNHNPKPDVITLSYGFDATTERCDGTSTEPGYENLFDEITNAVNQGIVVVAAAGNSGPDEGTIKFPACMNDVIAVGASTKDDQVWDKSSRGPSPHEPQICKKPDVVAPGVDICAANSSQVVGEPFGEPTCDVDGYVRANGTSLAAPHVAGLVALIKEIYPSATVNDIKYALKHTDHLTPWPWDYCAEGYGRVNIIKAVNAFGECYGSCTDKFICDPDDTKCIRCDYRHVETMVPDPSFEDNVGWNCYGCDRSSDDSHTGDWSLLITINQENQALYWQASSSYFEVEPSTTYTLKGWYRFASGSDVENASLVVISWYDSRKSSLFPLYHEFYFDKIDGDWHGFSQSITSPADAYYGRVGLGIGPWITSRSDYALYFDDVYLVDTETCESDDSGEGSRCTASTACDEKEPGTSWCVGDIRKMCGSTCQISTQNCRTDAYDSDGSDYKTYGYCIDYQGCSGESCTSTRYEDQCQGDYVKEAVVSGSTCTYLSPYNCKNYGSDYYCYYGRCTSRGGGGGGCPFVYTWNGSKYVIDNNLLLFSEVRSGDVKDYYKLEKPLIEKDGKYSLLIKEFENEHDYFDRVNLIAVDHDSSFNIAVNPNGDILTYENPVSPESAVDNNEENVLDILNSADERYYEGDKGDYIVLNFGKVNVRNAKLLMKADFRPFPVLKSIHVQIQVKNDNKEWEDVAVVIPRNYWATEVIDLSNYLSDVDDELELRLYFTKKHKIDFVGLDMSEQEGFEVKEAELISADHSTKGDVKSLLQENDDTYTELIPGEQIELEFTLPDKTEDVRDFILFSEGHYVKIEENSIFSSLGKFIQILSSLFK